MTEEKLSRVMQELSKSNLNIKYFIMEMTGDINNYGEAAEPKQQKPPKPAKKEIMDYVGKLKPVVVEDVRNQYDEIWSKILELEEVRSVVYDKGKQQGTTFNRNLVANIIHMMVLDNIVVQGTKDVEITELLEPAKGKSHPVRMSLGLSPEIKIKQAVEQLFIEMGVKV